MWDWGGDINFGFRYSLLLEWFRRKHWTAVGYLEESLSALRKTGKRSLMGIWVVGVWGRRTRLRTQTWGCHRTEKLSSKDKDFFFSVALTLLDNAFGTLDLTLLTDEHDDQGPTILAPSLLGNFRRYKRKSLSQPHVEFDLKWNLLAYWLGFTPSDFRLVPHQICPENICHCWGHLEW